MTSRVAILDIQQGSLAEGFPVALEIRDERGLPAVRLGGRLPGRGRLEGLYECWQHSFRHAIALYSHRGEEDWSIDETLPTHRSTSEGVEACRSCARELEVEFQGWLRGSGDENWSRIREKLREEFARSGKNVRLVVQAREMRLWKLPWHAWDLLESYPEVGVGYSFPEFEQPPSTPPTQNRCVRILGVLGDNRHLDLAEDRRAIADLNGAAPQFLEQPTAKQMIQTLRQGWQVFFFAGHSRTEKETGRIYLSDRESLTIEDFKHALKEAIRKGLKIAIFNSCDGLGLAQQLADLHIPAVIVMQEVVPDRVAQSFVREFLQEYAGGRSLHTAVRVAQERLEEFAELPGCTSLPLLCQNPATLPPTWGELRDGTPDNKPSKLRPHPLVPSPKPSWRRRFSLLLLSSLLATGTVMSLRWMGLLQTSELQAYDRFMRSRPVASSSMSDRLLIVEANEEDLRTYNHPLSDEILAQLLDKLQQHDPIAIGVDIYRDLPEPPGRERLAAHLKHNEHLIVPCKFINQTVGVNPPPESPSERVGFVNALLDGHHEAVRRYLLSRTPRPNSPDWHCDTPYSFSFALAFRYLYAKGYPVTVTPEKDWKFGEITFKRLETRSGGYQNLDARGNQILINYGTSVKIARQVTLTNILSDRFDPAWIEDKVVLVGVTAESVKDSYYTPLGKIRGLYIHAHTIAHILDAVAGRQVRLWWLPQWGDAILVEIWAVIGGGIGWLWRKSPWRLGFVLSCAIAVLSGLYFWVFLHGGWLPFIPSVLALVAAAAMVPILQAQQHS